jgi:hypothetical protein
MPEKIVIPYSFADYVARFRRPAIKFLGGDRVAVVQAIVDAWSPWDFKISNMELRTEGNLAEQGINFKLPDRGVSFFVTAMECRFNKENASWSAKDETLELLGAVQKAALESTSAEIATQALTLSIHFQPRTKSSKSILGALAVPAITRLYSSDEPTAYTYILKWNNSSVALDGSINFANGIFLRLSHEFDDKADLGQIAKQLREDELSVFRMLDVEEVANE